MAQSSYFKSRPDLVTLVGGVGWGNRKSREMLIVEKSGWNFVGRISKCRRYVTDVTGLDVTGELGGSSAMGSSVLLDVLGRWKLVGVFGTCTYWLDKVVFPDSTIRGGAEGRGKIWKNEEFLTYEWLIWSEWILIFRKTSCLRALILNPDRH